MQTVSHAAAYLNFSAGRVGSSLVGHQFCDFGVSHSDSRFADRARRTLELATKLFTYDKKTGARRLCSVHSDSLHIQAKQSLLPTVLCSHEPGDAIPTSYFNPADRDVDAFTDDLSFQSPPSRVAGAVSMATKEGGPLADGSNKQDKKELDAKTQKDPQSQKDQPKPQPKDQQPQADAGGDKKLSNAELKKKAKEEKAARRAQAKVVPTAPPAPSGGQHAGAGDAKGAKGKPKPEGHPGHQSHGQQQHAKLPVRPAAAPKEAKPAVPECFSHLSMARRLDMTHADKDVHPAVLVLGQHMSTFAISDSITRLEATLVAFKKVKLTGNDIA